MLPDRVSDIADISSAGNVVRVKIPVGVYGKLDVMQRVTASVLGQLGCEACHSGFDIRYDVVREFVFDGKQGVKAAGG